MVLGGGASPSIYIRMAKKPWHKKAMMSNTHRLSAGVRLGQDETQGSPRLPTTPCC
ncbi:rCG27774 [Rattus norvegicus]|uniref:RCG27774 n=1 Tax=Rattus norvegicus TaxID=10116 RepID=A6KBK6_RAT|nr:rCG27774 [Rattus norvegicus]